MRYTNTYNDEEKLQLLMEEDEAVFNHFFDELKTKLTNYFKQNRLSLEDIEELLLDTISIFIQKVKNKEYVYNGTPIIAYMIKVAKYRATYYYRRNGRYNKLPHDIADVQEPIETKYAPKWELIEQALLQLSDRERKLIELTFFEGYKDKEILDQKLVDYSTIDSIKTQRYKCIKKLVRIVRGMKS